MDDIVVNIGEKIRKLRKKNNLSIQKLAEKSGVSPAGIHKIETSGMTPTITTLMKIANALEKKVSFFIEEDEQLGDLELIRMDRRKRFFTSRHGIKVENIAGRLENSLLEAGISTMESGGNSGDEFMTHRGEELIYVLRGKMEITVRDKVYMLDEGDSLHFKSEIPHSWRNAFEKTTQFLWVLTPPALS